MKILIDADGCPVTKIVCREAKKYNIECIIICDTSHVFNIDGIETITVSKGADSVDFYLVNRIEAGDIVVTQDYGLAAMCLAKKAEVISQNGVIYNDDNILALLNKRHTAKKLRMSGVRLKGPAVRDKSLDNIFAEKLDFIFAEKLDFLIEKNLKM